MAAHLTHAAHDLGARQRIGVGVQVPAPHLDAAAGFDQLVAERAAAPALAMANLAIGLEWSHLQREF